MRSTNPASYTITVSLYSTAPGTTYTLGTDIGPIDPFSGTLPTAGWQPPMTFSFTTLVLFPLPDSVTVEVALTMPDGSKCFIKEKYALPSCSWIAERSEHSGDTAKTRQDGNGRLLIGSSMLVFPNPTTGNVTISYDYGTDKYNERSIAIYDAMGRKIGYKAIQDVHGSWLPETQNWLPGIYIIRMEADGQALQTQRMVVVSR